MEQDRNLLDGDSVALIVAGRYGSLGQNVSVVSLTNVGPDSDTVASTLIYLFYRLALDPHHAERLRAEALGADIYNRRALQSLDHLNGCINEILRLHPSVPTGGYRETPAKVMWLAQENVVSSAELSDVIQEIRGAAGV